MSVRATILGNPNGPLLCCVHGVMGGPEDFNDLTVPLQKDFQVVIFDLMAQEDKHTVNKINHAYSGKEVAVWLRENFPGKVPFYLCISYGAKIVYDLIESDPDLFGGGVATDAGPGEVTKSDFLHFILEVLPSINRKQSWPSLRLELAEKIPVRNMRVLISSKLYYPDPNGFAEWRPGMFGFTQLMHNQTERDQWHCVQQMPRTMTILKAANLSMLSSDEIQRIKAHNKFVLKEVPDSTHFLHVSHHKVIQQAVYDMRDQSL